MKIGVCIKQVPDSSEVEVDPVQGTLKRQGKGVKTNPYDLYAVETALQIKESLGGSVTAITMGPSQSESMMQDVFMMGVDEAVILSDMKFAGADVLATSYTLAQGIRQIGEFDLLICGRQTTDGDTAQIGPALAEHLGLPHVSWVSAIEMVTQETLLVSQQLEGYIQESEMTFPCLITVEKDIYVPRLPSYRLKKECKSKEILYLSFADLEEINEEKLGLQGSPTKVEAMFPPEGKEEKIFIEGDVNTKASNLIKVLRKKKVI